MHSVLPRSETPAACRMRYVCRKRNFPCMRRLTTTLLWWTWKSTLRGACAVALIGLGLGARPAEIRELAAVILGCRVV